MAGDFRKRSDSDFGDEPRWKPGDPGKIDAYSASMMGNEGLPDATARWAGMNDPRPTAGAAADDLSDAMAPRNRGGSVTARGKETMAKLRRRHGEGV
jgi:hypothetical protein